MMDDLADVSIPIEHDTTCDVALCSRPATRAALTGDGYPFALCEAHRPWAKFMDRVPDEVDEARP
jgi:hypothetical protein